MKRLGKGESLQGLELLERDPKTGSRGGIRAVLEMLQQRAPQKGKTGASKLDPALQGEAQPGWPRELLLALAWERPSPMRCGSSPRGMCWKRLEQQLPGAVCSQGL